MPQASEELRKEWMSSTDEPSDQVAMKYLQEHGYKLTRSYQWILPTPAHLPTEKEQSAIRFLINEWDFGGVTTVEQAQTESLRQAVNLLSELLLALGYVTKEQIVNMPLVILKIKTRAIIIDINAKKKGRKARGIR